MSHMLLNASKITLKINVGINDFLKCDMNFFLLYVCIISFMYFFFQHTSTKVAYTVYLCITLTS